MNKTIKMIRESVDNYETKRRKIAKLLGIEVNNLVDFAEYYKEQLEKDRKILKERNVVFVDHTDDTIKRHAKEFNNLKK